MSGLKNKYSVYVLIMCTLACVCVGSVSCDLDDERDWCCKSVMNYYSIHGGVNRFEGDIDHMEYYLFDSLGNYLQPMVCIGGDWRYVDLASLRTGSYTLVALANLEKYGSFEESQNGGLSNFRLKVNDFRKKTKVAILNKVDSTFNNGDALFWGLSEFNIKEGDMNSFVTNMNHIHCNLQIKVEWEQLPEYKDGYAFQLDGVGTSVLMNEKGSLHIKDFVFPAVESFSGSVRIEVPLRQLVLEEQMTTLRYSDRHIPTFTLYHGDKPTMKPIELAKVFKQWGWSPDSVIIQDYKIRMLIRGDGKIEVHQGLNAEINDWIDGGTIGG